MVGSGGSGGAASDSGLIAPRIRRLTNAEYDATVQALLGTKQTLGASFVPDSRLYKHARFDRNEAQVVEPVLARQLQQAAANLANEYVQRKLDFELPCTLQADEDCARVFFSEFLPRAYRRAVSSAEFENLMRLVVVPALPRDGFRSAIGLGIEAVLQSTAFLYHSELGPEAPPTTSATSALTLANSEIADALSYLLTGGPPDAVLTAELELASSTARETHARRLLQTPGARVQVRRMVKQWLGIDEVAGVRKDMTKFMNFAPDMFDRESNDFIDEVVFNRNGDFELLMGADFTVGFPELAAFYGAEEPDPDSGLIDLRGLPRRGILNRGAFLATYATPELPSPIKRGARFVTQTLCLDPGDPNALNLRVALPPLNPTKTTRARFEEHNQAICKVCHDIIDSVGFTFQHFNAIGAWEASEDGKEALPIDSTTTLKLPGVPFGDQPVADSSELALLLSESEVGRRCFARNLARFSVATHGEALERGFLEEWQKLAAAGQDSVQDLLVAYVKSRFFVERDAKGAAP